MMTTEIEMQFVTIYSILEAVEESVIAEAWAGGWVGEIAG